MRIRRAGRPVMVARSVPKGVTGLCGLAEIILGGCALIGITALGLVGLLGVLVVFWRCLSGPGVRGVQGIQRGQSVVQRVERGSCRALRTPGATGDKNGGVLPLPGFFVQILVEIEEKQRKASFPRLSKNQGIQCGFLRVCPRGKTGVQWVNSSVIFK